LPSKDDPMNLVPKLIDARNIELSIEN